MGESSNEDDDGNYTRWLEESDPDDVDYVGPPEKELNHDGTRVISDDGSSEEDEDSDEEDEDSDEDSNEDVDEDGNDNVDDDEVAKKRKRKSRSESEDEEELMERFEYEVEASVDRFIDELSVGRNQMPDCSVEDEDPMELRDRRIRRGRPDRLGLGNTFFTGVEFKETVLDYALLKGKNIKQERYDENKLTFKCGMGWGCKWRVYASYDRSSQVWQVKSTFTWHSCTPNGKCDMLKSPHICRLFLDKIRLNPDYMPTDIQTHIKERWKLVS